MYSGKKYRNIKSCFPVCQVFTSIFTLECTLKVIAISKEFFRSGWNIFDLIVVVASLVELSLQNINGLSVLRVLRLVSSYRAPLKNINSLSCSVSCE